MLGTLLHASESQGQNILAVGMTSHTNTLLLILCHIRGKAPASRECEGEAICSLVLEVILDENTRLYQEFTQSE